MTQTAYSAPKNKAINPIIIGIVTVTMVIVMIVTVAPSAIPGQSGSRPSGATQTIDNSTQQRINNLEQALTSDTKNLGILVELGNTYFDVGQYGKAIDRYSAALDIDPNNTNVRVDMGISYYYLGMVSQAIAEYRKALDVDPQKPQAHLNLGIALADDTPPNVDEAVAEWQKAIQYGGGSPDLVKKAQDQINKYKR